MPEEMFSIADKLLDLKDEKDRLAELTSTNNKAILGLENQLADALVESGTDGFRRNGRTFFYTTKVFVRPNKNRKAELYDWLSNNGYSHMVEASVNTNTLRSAIKEMMESNDGEVPAEIEGLVIVDVVPTVGVRRVG